MTDWNDRLSVALQHPQHIQHFLLPVSIKLIRRLAFVQDQRRLFVLK